MDFQARPVQYAVAFRRGLEVPGSEPGVLLAADLHLPEAGRPTAAVVTLHNARRDALGGMSVRRYSRYFAERGYAVVLVDCRGTGDSSGASLPTADRREVLDGLAVVDWVARQPWCNGRVGMWGLSAGAVTALATAAEGPEPLKAIIPVMGFIDPERDLVHPAGHRGGLGFTARSCLNELVTNLMPPLLGAADPDRDDRWRKRAEEYEPWFVDAWRNKPGSGTWRTRRVDPSRISIPTFCVAGWRDVMCKPMFEVYDQVRAPKRLLVGPWLHNFPDASPVEPVEFRVLACQWWDRWLGDPAHVGAEDERPVLAFVEGSRKAWVTVERWPPRIDDLLCLNATTDGRLVPDDELTTDEVALPGMIRHRTDPTVGAHSGLWSVAPITRIGYPLDQHEDDTRSLTFTSRCLPRPVTLAGRAEVRLAVDSSNTAHRCVVKLTDVDPGNRSTVISLAVVDLPAEPEGPASVVATLDPKCYQLAEGHRIRLTLSDSDFPRLWPSSARSDLVLRVTPDAAAPQDPTTVVRVPVVRFDAADETTVSRPDRSGPARRSPFPPDEWSIARDHIRDTLTVLARQTDGGTHLVGAEKSLRFDRYWWAEVTPGEADVAARIVARGEFAAEAEAGDRYCVSAEIDVSGDRAEVTGALTRNGRPSLTRQWVLDDDAGTS